MISVVIPLYNASEYIVQAVDSALKQKVDMEIIVVNDCSTDNSVELLEKYLDGLKKESDHFCSIPVKIYTMDRNSGVAAARNKGVEMATGEYIAFLDADDMWTEGKLDKQLEIMEKTKACLCNTDREIMLSDGTRTGQIIKSPTRLSLEKLTHSNYINCSSVLVRREIMLEFPMEHSDAHEDYLTWLRILKKYDYAVGISEPMLLYRLSENGKSRNKLKSATMTYRTYRYAGYGILRSLRMMVSYTINGLKKYRQSSI